VRIVGATARDDVVELELDDGGAAVLHRFALRDGCPCAQCRHPTSGQRLFESRVVVPQARPAQAGVSAGRLIVTWQDGHHSDYPEEWLENEIAAAEAAARPPRPRTLWDGGLDVAGRRERFQDVVERDTARRRWLGSIEEFGFAVLTGAPLAEGTVARIADVFGHVRVTNYGRTFDVKVKVDATNLADTALALSLHTDNPYRDPAPTLQLLHCLSSTVSGGESILADGFRAVAELSAHSPSSVEILARTPIRFAYRDAGADLWADVPVIQLDPHGRVTALHVNNRSKWLPAGSAERVAEWYSAYFELLSLLEAPDAQVTFRLEPGDVLVFDNLRILHARTGFSGEGQRHLQGCYADRDGFLSSLAMANRKEVG
jgi:gamma-butyrobetaine dioxygenase